MVEVLASTPMPYFRRNTSMRSSLRGLTGLAATGLLMVTAVAANAAVERQLLNVKIWQTYRDVLAKHGQPTRIEIGAVESPIADSAGGGGGGAAAGPRAGGLPGMGGMGAMGGGGMSGKLGVMGMGASGAPGGG